MTTQLRDFHIEAGQDRFLWLLSHDGTEDSFRSGDAAYYASPARTSLDPDPAKLIVGQSTVFLRRVPLDPAD